MWPFKQRGISKTREIEIRDVIVGYGLLVDACEKRRKEATWDPEDIVPIVQTRREIEDLLTGLDQKDSAVIYLWCLFFAYDMIDCEFKIEKAQATYRRLLEMDDKRYFEA